MAVQENTPRKGGRTGSGGCANTPDPDKSDHKRSQKDIDETVEDTFPASDPPSWSPGTASPDKSK